MPHYWATNPPRHGARGEATKGRHVSSRGRRLTRGALAASVTLGLLLLAPLGAGASAASVDSIPPGCPQYPSDCPQEVEGAVSAADQTSYEALLTGYGVDLSTLTGCARAPWTVSGCPPVSRVLVTLTETACTNEVSLVNGSLQAPCEWPVPIEPEAAYAFGWPDVASPAPAEHGGGAACGVRAEGPTRTYDGSTLNNYMRGRGINHCLSGQGVQYSEVYATLQRERLDGARGWQNLDSTSAKRYGAGTTYTPYATWDCNHTRSLLYRVEAYAFSYVRGVGYGGLNRRTDSRTCPD